MRLSGCLIFLALTSAVVSGNVLAQEGPPEGARHPLMRALDSDGDGSISATEMQKAATALAVLDTNKDGKLSGAEIQPATDGARGVRRGGRDRRDRRGRRGRRLTAPAALAKPPVAKTEAEQKILDVLVDLDTKRRGNMNVPAEDGRLLRLLTEAMGAKHVVEVGTSNGYSGLWISLGLTATGGKLTTHEIDARRAAHAKANFERAGVSDRITIVMGDAHQTVTRLKGPIDIVFIDADKAGYKDYLQKLLPIVRPGGLILSHNMNRPAPHPEFIKAITNDSGLETLFLNMHSAGMGVSLKKR
jgi:caffeoyl-CoA O-methyltransferase